MKRCRVKNKQKNEQKIYIKTKVLILRFLDINMRRKREKTTEKNKKIKQKKIEKKTDKKITQQK